ncbi:MAG TPA: phosphatase PAP2 family protein [Acidimicrobiales bacterium]|nr:phosphatase PAP2 family protein [Acidimicrobiales bacterium]
MSRRAVPASAIAAKAAFVAGAWAARRPVVSRAEEAVFHRVNDLPAAAFPAVWAVMQSGSLGGVFAVAGTAAALGRRPLALRLAVAGTAVWAAAKAAKPFVRRGRPSTGIERYRVLGRPQTGLGYPSGHAAVAVTLAAVAAPTLGRPWRALAWTAAGVTGVSRIYVGAHYPLDVAGGWALGWAAGSVARRLEGG